MTNFTFGDGAEARAEAFVAGLDLYGMTPVARQILFLSMLSMLTETTPEPVEATGTLPSVYFQDLDSRDAMVNDITQLSGEISASISGYTAHLAQWFDNDRDPNETIPITGLDVVRWLGTNDAERIAAIVNCNPWKDVPWPPE
jgi:hypothetical protein